MAHHTWILCYVVSVIWNLHIITMLTIHVLFGIPLGIYHRTTLSLQLLPLFIYYGIYPHWYITEMIYDAGIHPRKSITERLIIPIHLLHTLCNQGALHQILLYQKFPNEVNQFHTFAHMYIQLDSTNLFLLVDFTYTFGFSQVHSTCAIPWNYEIT